MTALVLGGLSHAVKSDIKAGDRALAFAMRERGIQSAKSQIRKVKEQEALLLAHALCAAGGCGEEEKTIAALYGKRGNLSSYELALLLECLESLGKKAEVAKVAELLETKALEGTGGVFWASASSYSWYRQDEETTARVLRALCAVRPDHPLIPKAVRWLSRVKRDGYWACTKTTAAVIDALAFYLARSGEFDPEYTAVIELNGKQLVAVEVSKESLGNWKGRIVLPDSLIGGRCDVKVAMKGRGRLYYSVRLRYATGERPIKAAANGISVSRKYTRLIYRQGREGEWQVKREPFEGALAGGDELEVAVTVKSNRPCDYLLLEDFFPSGTEVLRKEQEWYSRWCGSWWYGYNHSEARDDRMVWFVGDLGAGERTFRYLLRAETPGVFVGLPARAELMYEPEVCGNSEETRARIRD